jgi:hypothetical protein
MELFITFYSTPLCRLHCGLANRGWLIASQIIIGGNCDDKCTANGNANENLTLHFKVKDFNSWRTSYNGNEKGRASAGITNGRVFRGADDQNEVIVLQDVADVAKARTWLKI